MLTFNQTNVQIVNDRLRELERGIVACEGAFATSALVCLNDARDLWAEANMPRTPSARRNELLNQAHARLNKGASYLWGQNRPANW
jgi:hypothetical protein